MIYLPVSKLKELCDPFQFHPWGVKVSETLVQNAINCGDLLGVPINTLKNSTANDHAARVAYFVVTGFQDPISLDVGIPSMGYSVDWMITDGNHRLAAAILSGLETVPAEFSGEIEVFKHIFDLSDKNLAECNNLANPFSQAP